MQSIVLNSIQSMVFAQKTKQARGDLVSLLINLRKLLTFHDTTTLEVIVSEEQNKHRNSMLMCHNLGLIHRKK